MENSRIFKTPEGFELLRWWSDGAEFKSNSIKTSAAARRLLPRLEILHGKIEPSIVYTFGLPYTSSSSFAAVWNTNTEARLRGTRLYFHGIAVTTDGKAVGVFTELDADGNEIGEKYMII